MMRRKQFPGFRCVYFFLATLMPLAAGRKLQEELMVYAANNRDRNVFDTFVQLFYEQEQVTAVAIPEA